MGKINRQVALFPNSKISMDILKGYVEHLRLELKDALTMGDVSELSRMLRLMGETYIAGYIESMTPATLEDLISNMFYS